METVNTHSLGTSPHLVFLGEVEEEVNNHTLCTLWGRACSEQAANGFGIGFVTHK